MVNINLHNKNAYKWVCEKIIMYKLNTINFPKP